MHSWWPLERTPQPPRCPCHSSWRSAPTWRLNMSRPRLRQRRNAIRVRHKQSVAQIASVLSLTKWWGLTGESPLAAVAGRPLQLYRPWQPAEYPATFSLASSHPSSSGYTACAPHHRALFAAVWLLTRFQLNSRSPHPLRPRAAICPPFAPSRSPPRPLAVEGSGLRYASIPSPSSSPPTSTTAR
jgi:hypothetical protein